jgi:Tfp pilus assembly protein PilF
MRDSSPRAPFDQGLFLTHLNKGKELYDGRRFEDAERELEEAYLLRPRDQKVLNLLGLVYFKQDKLEKAEEVYRKLVAESPDAHTLFYNLGLIYFKLSRLEEAESAFMKALELTQGNPKINFYLGSIYERLHRFQDAIYQYRQAGANIMVRRVEDKIAATIPPKRPPGPLVLKKPEDTAEFKARDIREALRRKAEGKTDKTEPAITPGKTLQPVSDLLMADGASPRSTSTDDTARFRGRAEAGEQHRFPEIISFLRGSDAEVIPERPRGPDIFRFLENNLMEIDFSGKVFIKQGTIYSYSGNLTFWVKDKRPGGIPALVIITGNGRVILTDKGREITFMQVEEETVYVEPTHLLACEETLTPRYVSIAETGPGPELIALEGRGMVALSVASKPLPLSVTPELPVSVPSTSVITWSGSLTPRVVDDRQLYEVMLPADTHAGPLVRLEGTGRVLVEQTMKG